MDMGARHRRRFRVLHAMALIGATAIGLAAYRTVLAEMGGDGEAVSATAMLLMTWSWATTLFMLRRPRPALRRLMRRPGHAACVATSFLSLLAALLCLFEHVRYHVLGGSMLDTRGLFVVCSVATPLAILASWCTMAFTGPWRATTDWTEWLGRTGGRVDLGIRRDGVLVVGAPAICDDDEENPAC